MFGFGLLGARFTIGTELTIITTQDNKTHFMAHTTVEDFKKTKAFNIPNINQTHKKKII